MGQVAAPLKLKTLNDSPYEYRADTHEAMMHIAAIKLFLNKI